MNRNMYRCKKQIPSLVCACKDAEKGTIKSENEWILGYWSIGRFRLNANDLRNKKYFEKI